MGDNLLGRRLVSQLAGLLFPDDLYCLSCGDFIARGSRYSLCPRCEQKLHWIVDAYCPKCGRATASGQRCANCQQQEPAFRQGFSCVTYGLREKELIHKLKYGNRGYTAKYLGRLMAERLAAEAALTLDYLVPVPMHRQKVALRGYNQAALLARAVSAERGIPCLPEGLTRVRDTAPMTEVSHWEREENIKNAFTVGAESARIVREKTLLLVDDVYTTGSTAQHCSLALLKAGAAAVYVLTFAAGADRSTIEIA